MKAPDVMTLISSAEAALAANRMAATTSAAVLEAIAFISGPSSFPLSAVVLPRLPCCPLGHVIV